MLVDENLYLKKKVDIFLIHHGIRGQKWGIRNSSKRESNRELKDVKKAFKTQTKIELKTIDKKQFRVDVGAAKKGKGVAKGQTGFEKTKKYGRLTGRTTGNFKNSKGEKVSINYANAVMDKAIKSNDVKKKAAVGSLIAAGILAASLGVHI